MTIIIWGHKYNFNPIGVVDAECPKCGNKPCELQWTHKKFTLYWVPLFDMNTQYALRCSSCKESYLIDKADGQRLQLAMQNSDPDSSVDRLAVSTQPAGPVASTPPDFQNAVAGTEGAQAAAMTCAKCDAALPQGARFCQECGAGVGRSAEKVCSRCGNQQSTGSFCANCGAALTM